MHIELLDEFLEIAAYGNMTQAASKLHMSPSNLSRRLSELEDETGVQLFFRDPSFRLTPAGAMFLNGASKVCHTYYKSIDESRQVAKQKTETVIVQEYSVDDAASDARFRVMSQVKERNRNTNIEMHLLSKLTPIDALRRNVVDIAQTSFVADFDSFCLHHELEGITAYPLISEKLFVCFDKRHSCLCDKTFLTVEDICGLAVRIPYGGYYSPMRDYVSDLFTSNGFRPLFKHVKQRSSSLSSFFLAGVSLDEIYIVPESMTQNVWIKQQSAELETRELHGNKTIVTTCMLVLDANSKQSVTAFRDVLKNHEPLMPELITRNHAST